MRVSRPKEKRKEKVKRHEESNGLKEHNQPQIVVNVIQYNGKHRCETKKNNN